VKNCPFCEFPNPSEAMICRVCGKGMDSGLRRTFSAVMLFGLLLFPLAAILSTSVSRGSLSINISTLTLILIGAGAAGALIGALGRSLVD
jgi:hypothetical protein